MILPTPHQIFGGERVCSISHMPHQPPESAADCFAFGIEAHLDDNLWPRRRGQRRPFLNRPRWGDHADDAVSGSRFWPRGCANCSPNNGGVQGTIIVPWWLLLLARGVEMRCGGSALWCGSHGCPCTRLVFGPSTIRDRSPRVRGRGRLRPDAGRRWRGSGYCVVRPDSGRWRGGGRRGCGRGWGTGRAPALG